MFEKKNIFVLVDVLCLVVGKFPLKFLQPHLRWSYLMESLCYATRCPQRVCCVFFFGNKIFYALF